MKNETISVIVPVYNVEDYLEECLDSLLAQTHENLEIILVDDGSTDRSGSICDRYGKMDSRIRVLHRENGGVSAARNAGLEAATGQWIGWVDSDDWVERDMFAFLLEQALGHGADIAVSGRFEEGRTTGFFGRREKTLLDREAALRLLLEEDGVDNALYDKLWNRELFRDIRFPLGKTYEDLAVVWQLFARAERVVLLPEQKYHYRYRRGSIMGNVSLPNRMAHHDSALERCEAMSRLYPELRPLLEERCVTSAVGIWCGYLRNPPAVRREYLPRLREIAGYVRPRVKAVGKTTGYGLAGRMVLALLPYPNPLSFFLAGVIGWLYEMRHGRAL